MTFPHAPTHLARGSTRFPGARATALRPALDAVSAHFGALVSPGALAPIARLADELPGAWHWAMVEARLRSEQPRVDFMACLAKVEGARPHVPVEEARRLAALKPAELLLDAWADDTHPVSVAPVIWFEWDMVDARLAATLVSVCVDPTFLCDGTPPPKWDVQRGVASQALALLVPDTALGARMVEGIEACIDALPPGFGILHVAPLHTRGVRACRITLGMRPPELVDWLARMNWPGDKEALAEWLPLVVRPWQRVFVQVETDGQLGPYLALETRPSSPGFPEREDRESFFATLVDRGLADPQKVRALLAWPGRAPYEDGRSALERSMYVKLTVSPAGSLEAKAYAGFRPASLDDDVHR